MRIQHNIAALNSYRNYTNNTNTIGKNLEKLSSGYRINRAGDDAAGLAISEKMRAQITGLETAQKNAQDGISLVQTAEGALTEVHSMLNRMVELADQSANGTYKDAVDRENLQEEVSALKDEIDRIADATNFNGINLLDGSLSGGANVTETFGTTELKFSFGQKDADILGGGAPTIDLKADKNLNDGEIKVTVDKDSGNLSVALSSKSAATYTTEQIEKAVRDEIAAKIAAGTDVADWQKAADAYASFNIEGGNISVKKDDATTMAQATLVDGTGQGLELQIGDTSDAFNKLSVTVGSTRARALGIADIDISTQTGAQDAVALIKDAINTVSSTRGTLGATQNRLEHTVNNLSVTTENMTAAESRIRDVDVAKEMMSYTKNNILVQSAQAMLAQANQLPQGVLQLLQ